MHAIKITPNLLFEYQCTSGKFIRLPNRIEKIDKVARIESKLFCLNLNALMHICVVVYPEPVLFRSFISYVFDNVNEGCVILLPLGFIFSLVLWFLCFY